MAIPRREMGGGFWATRGAAWWGVVLIGLALLVTGCSRSAYEARHNDIAQSHLPTVREAPHHPDSLRHLRITEGDQTFDFDLEKRYESMWRTWSVTRRAQTGASPRVQGLDYRTFATLWSLDLSLASLEPELGIQGLSKDLAREHIQERKENHQEFLQIDVYSYADAEQSSDTWLNTPGRRIVLRDGAGNEYEPARSETSIPMEAHHIDRQVVYRRNTFLFDRHDEDDTDILKDVQTLRLVVKVTGGDNYYFSWSFDDPPSLSSR